MQKILLICLSNILLLFSLNAQENVLVENLVKHSIEKFMLKQNAPGVAVAIIYKNTPYLFNFGYADLERRKLVDTQTIFEIASITKVFTTTLLALEIQQGKMKLGESIVDYVPLLKKNTQGPIKRVTLLDLATHTSSLPRMYPGTNANPSDQNILSFLREWTPTYPIAKKYVYSNLGFGLLGYAISQVEHENYESLVHQRITIPLNMSSTFVNVPTELLENYAQGYTYKGEKIRRDLSRGWPGGGALKSTSKDMLKFLKASLGIEGPENLLKAMQFTQMSFFKVNMHLTMGLGWQRFLDKEQILIVDKNGGLGGFSSYIGMIPEEKIGIVILINKGKSHATQLGREILKKLSDFESK